MTIYELFEKYHDKYTIDLVCYEKDDITSLDENEKSKYDLVINMLSLHENYRKPDKLFKPKMRWGGKRTFDLNDLSEEDYKLLATIELEKLPVVIRTRIHDVLWVTKHEFNSAQKAVEGYRFLFDKTYNNTEWTTCADMIIRALSISAQLGKRTDLYISVCEAIKSALVKEDGADPLFLSIVLLEELIARKYGVYSDYTELVDKIITYAIENNQYQHKVEEAFSAKKKLLLWGKQNTYDCDMALVSYYARQTEKDSPTVNDLFIAIKNLKKAVHIAKKCKEQAKATELLRKLDVLQKRIPDQMAKISHSIDMSESHAEVVKLFEGTSFAEDLLTLVRLVHIYSIEELRKQVTENNGLFRSLFMSSYFDEHGHTIFELPPIGDASDERVLNLHMFRTIEELTDFDGRTALWWALQELNRKHTFDENDLSFIFESCAIVRPGREKILAIGMNSALHGKFYEALHILAPQAENMFRYIAEENGGLVYTLEDDDTSKAKTLSSIFDIPELIDCYDPDYLFTFRGLLNEKAGCNIRNLIAHGLLEPNAALRGSSVYFCMAFLKICALTSQGFYQKIKEQSDIRTP